MKMKISQILGLTFVLALGTAQASTIAIVDSGNDFLHVDLAPKTWINPIEIASNDRDEDRNGYPDDVNGWNFAESNNVLIDYSYSWSDTADVRRFFDIQLKSFLGTLTQADREWANAKIKEEKFIREISVFGNWMHGTHVTGIAAQFSRDARMVGIKLIPTEVKLPGQKDSAITLQTGNKVERFEVRKDSVKDFLLKQALGALAKQQSVLYGEIGTYIKGTKADVMNGSFGTSYAAISGLIGQLYQGVFRKPATPEELKKYTDHFFVVSLEEGKIFLKSAPNTLFVFAAGNDGTDNDVFPTSPTNVVGDNKISVAATLGDQAIASFSNYGVKNVEVAAPGVGIKSMSPQNKYVTISGTSQAAPYVAGIAGAVKDTNPALDFRAIKRIILETVDVKSWLVGKVKTSGLVNAKRAVRAAELSRSMDLTRAIAQSKLDVLAKSANDKDRSAKLFQVPTEWISALPSPIIVK
jgi:subtilisin family serine protease